ncbi:MAG: hypothetical protein ABIS50_14420 [Luteolibacter sp.]|uniref:hypothetical protein n=1 Tax=Luteolibacter sp. TaxID=1962973 RepID=UPI003265E20F
MKCQLAVGFFLVATMACGDAQLTDKALETLKARWKPTVAKEMPLTELDAPNGYVVLKEPAADAQEARRVDKAAKVKVKFYMDRGNRRFYMTEWNWNNAGKGGKFNWVMLNPVAEAPAKPEAGKLDALYNDLRHDQTQWNCENAYGEFGKIVNQPEVVEFLVAKLATEKDAQAKSCVVALLCTSSQYKHDATFARTVLDLLIEYQAKRSNGFHDKAGVPEPERLWLFVSSSGASLNCVWIRFLVRNTPKYEELLSPVMLDPKADFYLRWVCIHAMARHKLMEKYYPKLDPDFYRMLFENLRNDGHGWNAQFATRILVILKPVSTPYIIQRLNEPRLDDQEKDILNLINKDILLPANRGKFEFKYGNLNSSIFGTTADTNDKFDCELSMFKN